jgi:transposase
MSRENPRRRSPRLTLERLPGYAPDLNPVEMIRTHLKHGLMANFVPADALDLGRVVRENLAAVRGEPKHIRSFWSGSDLFATRTALPAYYRNRAATPR